MKPPQRLVIGLTGGIGSGKTGVSDHLAQKGVQIIDTDAIAHQLTAAGGSAMPEINRVFGEQFQTSEGALDRSKMRELVFRDPSQRMRLEAILHPMIREAVLDQLATPFGPYSALVIPLLVEKKGWDTLLDAIVVVDCPREQQIERVSKRNGLAVSQIEAILATQASREDRLRVAFEVIDNSADFVQLINQTDALHSKLLQKASELRSNLQENDR